MIVASDESLDVAYEEIRRICPYTSMTQRATGAESIAFALETPSGERRIARIGARRLSYERDQTIGNVLRPAGISVPEVYAIADSDTWNAICISQEIMGTVIEQLPTRDRATYIHAAVTCANTLHEVTFPDHSRAGPLDKNGIGMWDDWRTWVTGDDRFTTASVDRLEIGLRWLDPSLESGIFDRIRAALRLLVPSCPELRQLVHGDYAWNNLIGEKGNIVGVIDWAAVMIGDPLYDLARTWFWTPWVAQPLGTLFEDMLASYTWDETFAKRLCAYALRSALRDCARFLPDSNIMLELWIAARADAIAKTILATDGTHGQRLDSVFAHSWVAQ